MNKLVLPHVSTTHYCIKSVVYRWNKVIYLSIYLSIICLSVYLSIYLSVYLSTYLYLQMYLTIYLSICLSISGEPSDPTVTAEPGLQFLS